MLEQIKEHLDLLEKERNIKILMAIESGSRAWGFPSPDSDYDVRIIYMHPMDWYLSIGNNKDHLEYFHGELMDIGGWDIRKALGLLRKSNATPFEWNQSPIVYRDNPEFQKAFHELAGQFFQPRHTLNHYIGIALNSYKALDGNHIKLKKLFYVIRPLLAAKWIAKKQTIPPMDIFNLMPMIEDDAIEQKIRELITIKSTSNEDFMYDMDADIKSYVNHLLDDIRNVDIENPVQHLSVEPLDEFFRALLRTS